MKSKQASVKRQYCC